MLRSAAVVLAAGFSLLGCSTESGVHPLVNVQVAEFNDAPRSHTTVLTSDANEKGTDYDPLEGFNDKTFWFNHDVLDRYALKPVATIWANSLPEPVRQSLANAFDNLAMPRRFVNKVLQGRFEGAGVEIARFLINTTAGAAGFFDVAAHLGLMKSDADTGQTFGVYGVGPGPYLVVPLLPPLDVRDAIGHVADSFIDPLSIFVTPFFADLGRAAGKTINERANNLKLYQDAEDTSLDLYAAVRNGYLQRRQSDIEDANQDRVHPESLFTP